MFLHSNVFFYYIYNKKLAFYFPSPCSVNVIMFVCKLFGIHSYRYCRNWNVTFSVVAMWLLWRLQPPACMLFESLPVFCSNLSCYVMCYHLCFIPYKYAACHDHCAQQNKYSTHTRDKKWPHTWRPHDSLSGPLGGPLLAGTRVWLWQWISSWLELETEGLTTCPLNM